jgi:hypothetical protein
MINAPVIRMKHSLDKVNRKGRNLLPLRMLKVVSARVRKRVKLKQMRGIERDR